MDRKVAQTELEPQEYETLLAAAQKSGLSINEALREAVLRWAIEESGIDPKDPSSTYLLDEESRWRLG